MRRLVWLWIALAGCEGEVAPAPFPTVTGGTPTGTVTYTPPTVDRDGDGVLPPDDCDDFDASVYPDALELCDGLDNDCNGASDEPFDADGDGWGDCAGDCNDDNDAVFPGAPEPCDDLDNDCDGRMDEDDDLDGDGFATCRGDCDDANHDAFRGAPELCDGADNDCDGTVDEPVDQDGDGVPNCGAVVDCDDADPTVAPGFPERCNGADDDCDGLTPVDEVDADLDGVRLCDGDCDDGDAARAPVFHDDCDGIDNDCDPATDEAVDGDGDGLAACDGDCDDRQALAFPGGTETCNGADDDCDGAVDPDPVCAPCNQFSWGGHSYLSCPLWRSWSVADAGCRAVGYHLVTLDDAVEDAAIAAEAAARLGGSAWCGFNDIAQEGVWSWSSGAAVAYTGWAGGEPNDSGGEDCAQFNWSPQWNDASCDTPQPYMCESL